jgi:hypothetical protein
VAEEVAGIERPPPGTPGPLRMGRSGELEAALAQAGFAEIGSERVAETMEFASAGEYAAFTRDLSTSLARALAGRPAEIVERTWGAVEQAARAFELPGGRVRFANQVWCAWGRAREGAEAQAGACAAAPAP